MLLPTAALPIAAAAIYAACALVATGALATLLGRFDAALGINFWVALVVPALLAALFALLLYRDPLHQVQRVMQSVTRGLLIALLTWLSVSLLAAWAGCPPDRYPRCLSAMLLASGAIGGGPLLLAGLVAGFGAGVMIRQHRPLARMQSDK